MCRTKFLGSLFVVLYLAVIQTSFAFAEVPPSGAVLQVNVGMHTDSIYAISTDLAGRWVVTASQDKTAKVWNAQTGELLTTLRPPIARGNEGKLYACSMSGDGSRVAVGGLTSLGSRSGYTVYLFDRASGQMVNRLLELKGAIHQLSFSPDGMLLAVGEDSGVQIFNVRSPALPLETEPFGGYCYGLSWSADDRLVSTSDDGFIRLHQLSNGSLSKIAQFKVQEGRRPFGVAFSPDGQKILVGYDGSMAVELFDGRTLAFLQSLEVPSSSKQADLAVVCWSSAGEFVFAGGTYWKNGATIVRRWSAPGFTKSIDIPTTADTVSSLKSGRDGSVLVTSQDPAWGIINPRGIWTTFGKTPIPKLNLAHIHFNISDDAKTLEYESLEGGTFTFDLKQRTIHSGGSNQTHQSDTTSLEVSDWHNNFEPKLDGQKLDLLKYEDSRCLAISPDHQSLVLGTSWYLRRYDSSGKIVWRDQVPGIVCGVNIARSGKIAVVEYGDGTIRWHQLSDGKELLAYFSHSDGKRWVLWTPSGYYDASFEGEELIGWHVNQGLDQAALFFPASQFRDRFHRPDVIDRILDTLDEDQAVSLADQAKKNKSP